MHFYATQPFFGGPVGGPAHNVDIKNDIAHVHLDDGDGSRPAIQVFKSEEKLFPFTSLQLAKQIASVLNDDPVTELEGAFKDIKYIENYGCEFVTDCGSVQVVIFQTAGHTQMLMEALKDKLKDAFDVKDIVTPTSKAIAEPQSSKPSAPSV